MYIDINYLKKLKKTTIFAEICK